MSYKMAGVQCDDCHTKELVCNAIYVIQKLLGCNALYVIQKWLVGSVTYVIQNG